MFGCGTQAQVLNKEAVCDKMKRCTRTRTWRVCCWGSLGKIYEAFSRYSCIERRWMEVCDCVLNFYLLVIECQNLWIAPELLDVRVQDVSI